jgi:hypothetical protein
MKKIQKTWIKNKIKMKIEMKYLEKKNLEKRNQEKKNLEKKNKLLNSQSIKKKKKKN